MRDLPWSAFTATVMVAVYRVNCPDCGVKREKVPLLPSKAPFSRRFEEAVGLACEMASARQVARQFKLPASTVRAIDLRYLERWKESRRQPALRQMGVDEIYLGKKEKFLSVVCNLETGEPLWFGRERKKETLDGFFQTELSAKQRRDIPAACVDMWEPYRLSIQQWAPQCQIIYDKFHIMQRANAAMDEVRRAEFFRKGGSMRGLVKGKRWLLLSRWVASRYRQEAAVESVVRAQPAGHESVSVEGELRPAVDLPLRRRDASVLTKLDRSITLAAAWALRKAGPDVAGSSGGHSQLLPHQGGQGCCRSRERKYQEPAAAWPRVQKSALSPLEGSEDSRDQD